MATTGRDTTCSATSRIAPTEPVLPWLLDRRSFLAALTAAPLLAAGCTASSPPPKVHQVDEFTLRHRGDDIRCLYYDRQLAGDRPGCLAIVLLHGANADATQWFDIGLVEAIDNAELTASIHRIVAIAPDIADHNDGAAMVTDVLLPAIDSRFAPGHVSLSGISRGAAVAVVAGRTSDVVSVGLHSPAVRFTVPVTPVGWRCWIDCGDGDPLSGEAHRLVGRFVDSGIDVTEHRWPGGHDRAYWRSHLPDYLAFHIDSAHRSMT